MLSAAWSSAVFSSVLSSAPGFSNMFGVYFVIGPGSFGLTATKTLHNLTCFQTSDRTFSTLTWWEIIGLSVVFLWSSSLCIFVVRLLSSFRHSRALPDRCPFWLAQN